MFKKQPVLTVTSKFFPMSILFPVKINLFPSLTNQFVPIANKPTCSQIQIPLSRNKYYYNPVPRSHWHAPNTITILFPDPTITHIILLPTRSQIPLSRTKYYYHPVPRSHCHAPNIVTNPFPDPTVTHQIIYNPVPRSHWHAPNTITTLFPDPTVTHLILLLTRSQIPLSRTKYYYHPVPRSHCHAPNIITNPFPDPTVMHQILLHFPYPLSNLHILLHVANIWERKQEIKISLKENIRTV